MLLLASWPHELDGIISPLKMHEEFFLPHYTWLHKILYCLGTVHDVVTFALWPDKLDMIFSFFFFCILVYLGACYAFNEIDLLLKKKTNLSLDPCIFPISYWCSLMVLHYGYCDWF